MESNISLLIQVVFARLKLSGDVGELPCNPGGGSPSLYKVNQSITGSLITKRNLVPYTSSGMTSEKSTKCREPISRRVERPNPERSTKGLLLTSLLNFSLVKLNSNPNLNLNSSILNLPCNPGGRSPSLYKVIQSIIGLLMTKRNLIYRASCGVTSEKSAKPGILISRRVEHSNPMQSTKGLFEMLVFRFKTFNSIQLLSKFNNGWSLFSNAIKLVELFEPHMNNKRVNG